MHLFFWAKESIEIANVHWLYLRTVLYISNYGRLFII
jgi:hypothetical protein